jgi:hypothetical protein
VFLATGSIRQTRISVLTSFDQRPDEAAAEWMQQETERLFSDAGLRFSWQHEKPFNHLGATDLVIWVRFHGECSIDSGAVTAAAPGALASIEMQDREIRPFITVDCDGAAAMVRRNRGSLSGTLLTRRFGRALGRLVAHELYHYLTQSAVHDGSELFGSVMSARSLISETLRFKAAEIDSVLHGLRGRTNSGLQVTARHALE